MPVNVFTQNPLKVFSDESVNRIHRSTLAVLQDVGVRVDDDEALSYLADYGIKCDRNSRRVFPDPSAVAKALKTVGRGYTVYRRTPAQWTPVEISSSTTHALSGAGAIKIHHAGQFRQAARHDLLQLTALHETLDHIHLMINVAEPVEMCHEDLYPQIAADLFTFTSKPLLLQANGRRDLEKIIAMGTLLAGGREELQKKPLFMTGGNAEAPMTIGQQGAEILIGAAQAGIPVSFGCYLMAGSTSPPNVPATIVQRSAVVLCALILTQAVRPGSRFDYTAVSGCCDPATADVITMSPRAMQIIAGSIQMGRHYNLITQTLAATESRACDAQATGERFFSFTIALLAGASIIQGATSEMAGMELTDYAQCVIDNEIAGYAFEFASGLAMEEMDEAVSAVCEVAGDPKQYETLFLEHPYTLKKCHEFSSRPDLFSAGMLSRWIAENRPELTQKAEQRVWELLQDTPQFVPPDLRKELSRIASA